MDLVERVLERLTGRSAGPSGGTPSGRSTQSAERRSPEFHAANTGMAELLLFVCIVSQIKDSTLRSNDFDLGDLAAPERLLGQTNVESFDRLTNLAAQNMYRILHEQRIRALGLLFNSAAKESLNDPATFAQPSFGSNGSSDQTGRLTQDLENEYGSVLEYLEAVYIDLMTQVARNDEFRNGPDARNLRSWSLLSVSQHWSSRRSESTRLDLNPIAASMFFDQTFAPLLQETFGSRLSREFGDGNVPSSELATATVVRAAFYTCAHARREGIDYDLWPSYESMFEGSFRGRATWAGALERVVSAIHRCLPEAIRYPAIPEPRIAPEHCVSLSNAATYGSAPGGRQETEFTPSVGNSTL